jgi:nitrogen fixation/metabolism regulation signal transduction histidine kinase
VSFRRRLLLLFALTVVLSVLTVTLVVSVMTRRAFDRSNDQRTSTLVAQFRREFTRRGKDVSRKIQAVAATSEVTRIAVAAAHPAPDHSIFLDSAQLIAESQQLDFLEFTDDHGTIISSAQWPAKFGYHEPLTASATPTIPFLKEEETPAGSALGLFAIRSVNASDRRLYIIGGIRLDTSFLASLDPPSGMRVLLYENLAGSNARFSPAQLIGAGNLPQDSTDLARLIERVQRDRGESTAVIHWGHENSAAVETVNAFPLTGADNQILGILLVASSQQAYAELRSQIRSAAVLAAATGLLLAVLLSSWAAARVTRPVEELARAAHQVAAGNWNVQVNAESNDEIGELANSFNRMTRELLEKQERLVQAERVAAWRDLARRLAHELKNPLFPLQLTVENLLRARQQSPELFDETFRESASTLLSEISNLKNIIGRFSDFSKMPQPHFQSVCLADLAKETGSLYQAQFASANIACRLELNCDDDDDDKAISADPDLLHRALSNLVLNAIEAMPGGGTMTLRTRQHGRSAFIEVSDTGKGIAPEDCTRLFTPYYTSKPHGTGLGLAIVQSIVSDHGGKISVSSEPGYGTTFIIELPVSHDGVPAAEAQHV